MDGWIGVDLDGTLAHYDSWRGPDHIGEPIPAMVERVKRWIAEGKEVRIFTARVYASPEDCDRQWGAAKARLAIEDWLVKQIGVPLAVTCIKDFGMIEMWDDRAVQVETNEMLGCPSDSIPVHISLVVSP